MRCYSAPSARRCLKAAAVSRHTLWPALLKTVAKHIVAPLSFVALTVVVIRPGLAGEWKIEYKPNGSWKQTSGFDTQNNNRMQTGSSLFAPSTDLIDLPPGREYKASSSSQAYNFEDNGPSEPKEAYVRGLGTVRAVLHWVRGPATSGEGSSSGGSSSGDSSSGADTSKPPSQVWVWEQSVAAVEYRGPTSDYGPITSSSGLSDSYGPTGDKEFEPHTTLDVYAPQGTEIIRDDTGRGVGKMLIGWSLFKVEIPDTPNDGNNWSVPLDERWFVTEAKAKGYQKGSISAHIAYQVALVIPARPDPDGDPQDGTNEEVMDGTGQIPFSVLAEVKVLGGGSQALEWLKPRAMWELKQSAPYQPLPRPLEGVDNGVVNPIDGVKSVFARFRSDQPSEPDQPDQPINQPIRLGLGFSTRNGQPLGSNAPDQGLPSFNSSFGPKQVKHIVNEQFIGLSPIEVFYASNATTHPAGGPPGYNPPMGTSIVTFQIPTPNWFYYYDQIWQHPSGGTIYYFSGRNYQHPEVAYSFFDKSTGYVNIGRNGHGVGLTARFGFVPGSSYPGFVGWEITYGIDTYARNITHEFKHKEIYDDFHALIETNTDGEDGWVHGLPDIEVDSQTGERSAVDPFADPDHDGLPTQFEREHNLDPLNPDTTGFIENANAGRPLYQKTEGDGETIAHMAGSGIFGQRAADWADDGLNYGPPIEKKPINESDARENRPSQKLRQRTQITDEKWHLIRWTYGPS